MRWLELGERGVRGSREVFAGVALEGEGRRHDLFREDAVSGVFLEVLGVHGVGHVLELVDELVSFRVPETQLVQFLVTTGGYLQRFFLAALHAHLGAQVDRDLHEQTLQALQLLVREVAQALVEDVQDQLDGLGVGPVQLAELGGLLQPFAGVRAGRGVLRVGLVGAEVVFVALGAVLGGAGAVRRENVFFLGEEQVRLRSGSGLRAGAGLA